MESILLLTRAGESGAHAAVRGEDRRERRRDPPAAVPEAAGAEGPHTKRKGAREGRPPQVHSTSALLLLSPHFTSPHLLASLMVNDIFFFFQERAAGDQFGASPRGRGPAGARLERRGRRVTEERAAASRRAPPQRQQGTSQTLRIARRRGGVPGRSQVCDWISVLF